MSEACQGAPLPRVAVHHLGCKLNQYEAEALKAGFGRSGWRVVPFAEEADVYVVNTCTVTGSGDADSRRAVRRARRCNPEALVVATGCYAQRRPEELRGAGAGLVVPNTDKAGLVDRVRAHLGTGAAGLRQDPPAAPAPGPTSGRRPPTRRFLQIDGAVAEGRTRGTLQVQDGCDEHCTFCIIPTVRGPGVSRPPAEVLAQARNMVEAGYRELALTGVHTGSYGSDLDGADTFADLVRQLAAVEGLERIRLNSIEPGYVSDRLIDIAADTESVCRHFHVPLQSGDDRVLRRMGRRYTAAHYAERITRIAHRLPGCAIGADVMAGFPGEGEEHFASTRSLLERLPVTYLHVFPYSEREGTPAQRLEGHHGGQVKRRRVRELIALGEGKRLAFHRRHLGRRVRVLVEEEGRDGLAAGLTDNYIRVRFETRGAPVRANSFVDLALTRARETEAFGEMA